MEKVILQISSNTQVGKDDIFANVDSDELFNELLDEVAKKNLEEITEMAINKIKNNQ